MCNGSSSAALTIVISFLGSREKMLYRDSRMTNNFVRTLSSPAVERINGRYNFATVRRNSPYPHPSTRSILRTLGAVVEKHLHIPESNHIPLTKAKDPSQKIGPIPRDTAPYGLLGYMHFSRLLRKQGIF